MREFSRMTQSELASVVGLTRTSVVNIEQGRQRPTLHAICEMAEAMRIDVAALLPERGRG
ncbi:MAG: helix-turn-helix domain-containing protein [Cyanobacteria bacterium REEB65]|nr:helix-turn-helix domain-containing protein [Cyanobacteria bacterium REEB65]